MRCTLCCLLFASLTALAGCDQNQAPRIVSISMETDSIPANKIGKFAVNAIDPEGDSLTYRWTASAGEFTAGNSSYSVEFKPPDAGSNCSMQISVSDGKTSVDSTFVLHIGRAVHELVGRVLNQSGKGMEDMQFAVSDPTGSRTVRTASDGTFRIANVGEGAVRIQLQQAGTTSFGLPTAKPFDTLITVAGDMAVTIPVRTAHLLIRDDGANTGLWKFPGVENDGKKYILNHGFLSLADDMVLRQFVATPPGAQDPQLYLVAEAAPSKSSKLIVSALTESNDYNLAEIDVPAHRQTYNIELNKFPQLLGRPFKLRLQFRQGDANYIYVYSVNLCCY